MLNQDYFIAQIREIEAALAKEGAGLQVSSAPAGGTASTAGAPQTGFITANTVGLELGHPATASIFMGMVTDQEDLIQDGRVVTIGKPLSELPAGRHSLSLILLTSAAKVTETLRRDLSKHVLSANRIDGVMVRMTSGRIWLRLKADAMADGLTLNTIGQHIITHIKTNGHGHKKAEVIFTAGERERVERFKPVAQRQARERSDRYREELIDKMACETGLDCTDCPENATCDVLREAVAAARRKAVENHGRSSPQFYKGKT